MNKEKNTLLIWDYKTKKSNTSFVHGMTIFAIFGKIGLKLSKKKGMENQDFLREIFCFFSFEFTTFC
jgi:hypothetical protein